MTCNLGSDKAAAAEPANGCSLPVLQTKDGNNVSHDSACMAVFRPCCILLSVVTCNSNYILKSEKFEQLSSQLFRDTGEVYVFIFL
jgi:hypothetical protein